ncbi:MAG: hypothetical protein JHC25_05485 [Thermodesulfobacterium sp.]|jgi:hypothetical protein|nr:hypothetical protein [Thermodesulfobacterium sp.]
MPKGDIFGYYKRCQGIQDEVFLLLDLWDLVEMLEEIVFIGSELRRPGDDGKSL